MTDYTIAQSHDHPIRPVSVAQCGALIVLLFVLLLFDRGAHFWGGMTGLALLAGYHLLTDQRYSVEQIRSAGLMTAHLAVYLLLCTLLVWVTTGEEESFYWVVYYLPVTVAASNLGLVGTLTTCTAASLLFFSQVPPRLYLDALERQEEIPELLVFCITFFIVGVMVQAFSTQRRQQMESLRQLNQRLISQQLELENSLRRLEQAEEVLRRRERLAALGEMAAGLAHEIRNPLGIIISSAQLLKGEAANHRLPDIITAEGQRLNRLVTDFLNFGRPAEPSRQPSDLVPLLQQTLESLADLSQQKGLELRGEFGSQPLVASVDAGQLRQVLVNLLLNAFDATSVGGTVQVRLSRAANHAVIEVTDSGCGIPPDLLEKIFNPFVTTKDHGAGLGLANVHRMVENHGGTIRVHSVLGAGTTFIVTLPLEG